MNIADYIISFLGLLGVKHIYGYPGSPLVPFLAAMERQQTVRWVLMRHENAAAMAAGAHARLTGQLGVCMATSGPGALNTVCGVVDSNLDHVPLLVLTGLVPTSQLGHWEFQDVNQTRLLASLLDQSITCIHPKQVAALLRNFIGIACQQHQAVHLAFPSDVLTTEIALGEQPFDLDPAMLPRPLSLMAPPEHAFELVVGDLEEFRLPVIVLGRRALGCGPAIERLAEKLGAPIITSLDGKGIVDESHPHALGVLGIFGFPAVAATQQILKQADVIVAFGVDTIKPFLTDHLDVQCRALIQCESEFIFLTHEYHRDRTLVGPLTDIADGLRDRVRPRPRNPVLGTLAAERAAFQTQMEKRSPRPEIDNFLHPREFLLALNEMLTSEAVLVLDTGVHTLWAAQYVQLTRRQRVIVSSHLGTMGFSLPAAIACQLAAPQSHVVVICGDGGFQMVVGELGTAAQNQLPLIIVIFNNGVLQNVLAQQAVPYGTALANPDFVALAHAYGADGVTVDARADIPAILQQAFHRPRQRPILIDLRMDPDLMFPLSQWEHYAPIPLRSQASTVNATSR